MLSSTDDFPELCKQEPQPRANKIKPKRVGNQARKRKTLGGESRGGRREEADLASDDGDGGERLPEGGERGGGAVSAVVPEHGAGALDAVHELDHVLHGLHRRRSGRRNAGCDGRF
jgi:hypothetical protein